MLLPPSRPVSSGQIPTSGMIGTRFEHLENLNYCARPLRNCNLLKVLALAVAGIVIN